MEQCYLSFSKKQGIGLGKLIAGVLIILFFSNVVTAQTIYLHNFDGAIANQAPPFIDNPTATGGTFAANLSNSSWTNNLPPNNNFTATGGLTGASLSVANSGSATFTYTLTFDIASGYQVSVTSFNFWRRRSTNGPQNWAMTINGISVGSGTVTTGGASVGTTAVASPVNNITGTVTVIITLSTSAGTGGTFRLDDFTLNGSVTAAPTLSVPSSGGGSLSGFGNVCISTTTGANLFTITGTALTTANVTVGPLTGFSFSSDNITFSGSLSLVHAAGAYSQNIYVKFAPTLVQSYNGNIPVGGGGAPSINVAATGSGVNTKPTISNGTVSNITTNAADVSATISATGCTAISAYGVEYSTVPGFANGSGTAVAGGALSGGNFTSNLVGLAPPGTTYYFHTYATNAGGTTYGAEGSFTLQNVTPTISVPASGAGSLSAFGNVCINTASINSFNLSGSVLNGTNVVIGPFSNYTFSTTSGGTYSNTLTLVNGGGTGYTYTGGVLTATIYVKFIPTAVTTYNGNIPLSGGGAAAINVAATGAGVNDAPTVTTGNAIFITTTSATLPGVITNAGCGVITAYGIEYSNAPFAPGAGTQIGASNLAGGNFSVDLSGLTINTTYYYYAYATNAGGTTYGVSNSFTTLSVPTKLVILSVSPASPTALAPFSVTIQAQDASGNPVDVTTDTDIQFAQAAGAGTFTFPNSNTPAATIPAGVNTITINDLYYDAVENNVGIKAITSAGMSLTVSPNFIFNVVAYSGPTTFIWGAAGSSSWFVSSGAQHWVDPTFVTTSVPPGASGASNTHLAMFSSYAALINTGLLGMNMTTVGGDYSVGAIYFNETYNTTHTGNVVSFGNSSGSLNGVLSLYGVNYNNVGGISGNNFTSLLIGNYMSSSTTKTFQVVNNVSGVQNLTLNLPVAGSIVAGTGNIININTLITGTQPLQFTGGGTLQLSPSGAASVNSFSGPITVSKGTLIAGNTGAFSTVSPNVITLGSSAANAGVLRLNGNSVTIGGLQTAGAAGNLNIVDNGNATATLTINNSINYTFAGALKDGSTGTLSLIKNGTGTITLTGTSTLTGTTVINSGKLVLKKTGGGTYPATGGLITVNGPGTLQISTDQTLKDLTLTAGGILIVDAGVTLTITGTYTTGTCTINNLGTIKLQGSSATQFFPGASATVTNMNNLTVQNPFGVTLNNSLNIAGTLTLNSGTFTVGAFTLTLNNPIAGTTSNFSANNTSSIVIAGSAAGVNIPSVVSQLKSLQVTNTVGSVLQGNMNVSTTLSISAGTLYDNQFILNGTANVTMTGGTLNLEQNTATLPGLTGAYSLTGGTVLFNGVGFGTDAQTIKPINYFNLSSSSTGDRILSPTGTIGVSNVFTPNLPANLYTIDNSTIDFNKTAAGQTIAGFTYYNLTVSGGSALTKSLGADISIVGTLTLATNTKMELAAFNATLKSTATKTANVAVINTANSLSYSGIGRFIVERYIPTGIAHGKSWQLLAVPVSGTQSVKAAWQEGNAPLAVGTPGLGTTISSEKSGAVSRGYDFYTPGGPSIKTYNSASNDWGGIDDGSTNTSALPIANKKGYMIFVRGDRSVQTSATAANVTTLRTSGKLFAPGTDAPASTTIATAGKYESAGNPYASAIDFTNVLAGSTNIDAKFYVWDPLLPGTSGLGYGGYQVISSSNAWKPIPGTTTNYPTGVAVSKIQSGQAFIVYSTPGGATLNFAESNKTSGSSTTFRVNTANRQFLRSWLKGATGIAADGNVVAFDQSFSNIIDQDDVLKMQNGTEGFGIIRNNKVLALEAHLPVVSTDTVYYHISNLAVQAYQFSFEPENFGVSAVSAMLVDKFTGIKTPVSLSANTDYNFSITADPASKASDRFYIVFKLAGPVPVHFVRISAGYNNTKNIDVNWKVENELSINHYELERSNDGSNFLMISNVAPGQNNGGSYSYNQLDTRFQKGADNYYRVKSVGNYGQVSYSAIVKVKPEFRDEGISVNPNPVIDKQLNLAINGLRTGIYTIELINQAGQVLYTSQLNVDSEAFNKTLSLGNNIPAGIYILKVAADQFKFSQQVFVK